MDFDVEDIQNEDRQQETQDLEGQVDHGDQHAPMEEVQSVANGRDRTKNLFKSLKKILLKKGGRMERIDVMKAACQFLANKISSTEQSIKRGEAKDQYDIYGQIWAKKLRYLDELTRYYAI